MNLEVVVAQSNVVQLDGNVQQFIRPRLGKDSVGRLANDCASRVGRSINAVTEATQDDLLALDAIDEGRDVLDRADGLEHPDDGLVCA